MAKIWARLSTRGRPQIRAYARRTSMRVEKKHVFTGGLEGSKEIKAPKLGLMFAENAPFNTTVTRSLVGRVSKPTTVTKRGQALSKKVGKITSEIPTPFLTNSKRS